MSTYAEIYTQQGLKGMIEILESRISKLEREHDSVGKTWTELKIKSHQKAVKEEIAEAREELKEIQDALNARIQLNLR